VRGCLSGMLVLVLVVVGGAWLLTPMAVDALLAGALSASGFHGTGTTVDAIANPPPLLLTGHADTVRIRSSDVTVHELEASSLELTLSDVSLLSRSFATVDGTLSGVQIKGGGTSLEARTATVHGRASAARVVLSLDRAQVEALVSSGVAAAVGPLPVAISVQPPDRIAFTLEGRSATGSLGVENGSLTLRPLGAGLDRIVLVAPPAGAAWQIVSVAVTDTGFEVELVVDFGRLIG
jgi:streptogramin lyase